MGKVNIRQKAKNAAAKRKNEENNSAQSKNPFDLGSSLPQQQQPPINMPTVEDFENKSVISFKALHGVTKTKKEKLKLRKKLWHEKIESVKEKAKKNKAKTPSSSGKRNTLEGENKFQLLLDSLPSVKDKVNELKASKATSAAAAANEASKSQKRKTEKQRRREDLKNIDTFNQVLQHPEFQKNPMDTILEHLKNKQEMEKNGELTEEAAARPIGKRRNRNRKKRRGGKGVEDME